MSTVIAEVFFRAKNWNLEAVEEAAQRLALMVDGTVDSIYEAGKEIEVEILSDEDLEEVEETLSDYIEGLSGVSLNVTRR